ncbi:MAG TPA: lysozyme, partial [Pseudolabrys sp.]
GRGRDDCGIRGAQGAGGALKASDACISLIKEFEGFASECYDDIASKQTIGYGHLIRTGERFGRIDEAEATRLLCDDLEAAEACVTDCVDVDLTQGQFDALCSFVFNLGCARLKSSSLLRKLNAGDYAGARAEFPKWSRVGQNQVPGLLRRRLAEQLLFDQ